MYSRDNFTLNFQIKLNNQILESQSVERELRKNKELLLKPLTDLSSVIPNAPGGISDISTTSSGRIDEVMSLGSLASATGSLDNLIVGSGSGDNGITIFTGSSVGDKGSIFFADATTGSNAEKKGQISYEQNNEIMTFFTNHTLAQQIDASGHVTKPRNPAFHVTGSTQTNINHNVDFYPQRGSSGAVIYDVGSDITLSDNISFSPSDVNFFFFK